MLTNCQSSIKKEDKANEKTQGTENYLADTQSDSVKVQQDTIWAYQEFLIESENKINTYEKEIAV